MHELAVARHLLGTVEAEALRAGAERVVTIRLQLGERSHISTDSLGMYFRLLASDSDRSCGAELRIERIPMRFECSACRRPYPVRGEDFRCPHCRGSGRLIDPGDQLAIDSLEVAPCTTTPAP
jgi:hydrogenase nickel incorporation protein HypA/HybF